MLRMPMMYSFKLVYARFRHYNTCQMKTSASRATLPLPAEDALVRLGERISLMRRTRLLTQADLASKTGVGLSTMAAIEAGSPTVQVGFYLGALYALDAIAGLDKVVDITEDRATLGRLAEAVPKRVRFVRRAAAVLTAA